jgi:hypothetical protein
MRINGDQDLNDLEDVSFPLVTYTLSVKLFIAL